MASTRARSVDGRLTAIILANTPGVALVRVLAPEPPKPADLQGIDAIIYDVPDSGARSSPALAALAAALKETAAAKIALVIFDRPNPLNGNTIEGPLLEDPAFPIPLRHGMTSGELATLLNAEIQNPKMQVVKMAGWARSSWQETPELDSLILSPGIGLLQAANVSVGLGTPVPFQWVGAPWMDAEAVLLRLKAAKLSAVSFSIKEYTPTAGTHTGVACRGIQIKIHDRNAVRSLEIFPYIADALRRRHPGQFSWKWDDEKKLIGNDGFQKLYERGVPPEELVKIFRRGPESFAELRKPYLLY